MAEGREAPISRPALYDASRVDEVSLRELYLTWRAGLPLIAIVMLVSAVAAFVFVSSREATYTAAATVSVTPPPVGNSSLSGIDLSIPTGIDFDAYRAVAYDGALIEAVVLEVNGVGNDPAQLRAATVDLVGRLELRSRTPASQARGHVTVDHVVTSGPADDAIAQAAELANAWAAATAAAVANVLSAPIDAAIASLTGDIAMRKAEFDAASDAWSGFLGVDERRALNDRLDARAELDTAQRARLAELEGAVAAADARVEALEDSVARQEIDADFSVQMLSGQVAYWQSERAALLAERDYLGGVLADASEVATSVRARLTDLEARAATLQRDLATASMNYYRVAPTVPTLQLQRQLVIDSSRLSVTASAPLLPEPRGRAVAVLASAVVGGLLATLFVFLRAAVREPDH